jgi:hypothetical protein
VRLVWRAFNFVDVILCPFLLRGFIHISASFVFSSPQDVLLVHRSMRVCMSDSEGLFNSAKSLVIRIYI